MSYGLNNSQTGITKEKVPSGYKKASINTWTPEMMEHWKSLFPHLGPDSRIAKLAGGDESTFNEIEAPALKQFSGLQGNMASRFSGMGLGGRKSSGFQTTSNQAASDFAQQLQSNRQSLSSQALKDLMGMSTQLLGMNPYETSLVEKPKPWWQEALTGFATGAGEGLGRAGGTAMAGG